MILAYSPIEGPSRTGVNFRQLKKSYYQDDIGWIKVTDTITVSAHGVADSILFWLTNLQTRSRDLRGRLVPKSSSLTCFVRQNFEFISSTGLDFVVFLYHPQTWLCGTLFKTLCSYSGPMVYIKYPCSPKLKPAVALRWPLENGDSCLSAKPSG